FGYVVELEQIVAPPREGSRDQLMALRDASPMYTLNPDADRQIVERVDRATEEGDTLGGIVEVKVFDPPFGLGSHAQWDRKLDGLLAQAVMSIQAIKGVEIGLGRSEEHTSELQSRGHLVCRLLLEKKKKLTHRHRWTCRVLLFEIHH